MKSIDWRIINFLIQKKNLSKEKENNTLIPIIRWLFGVHDVGFEMVNEYLDKNTFSFYT